MWILAVFTILNRLPFFVLEVWQQCLQTARLKGCRLHKPWWRAQRKSISFGLVSTWDRSLPCLRINCYTSPNPFTFSSTFVWLYCSCHGLTEKNKDDALNPTSKISNLYYGLLNTSHYGNIQGIILYRSRYYKSSCNPFHGYKAFICVQEL